MAHRGEGLATDKPNDGLRNRSWLIRTLNLYGDGHGRLRRSAELVDFGDMGEGPHVRPDLHWGDETHLVVALVDAQFDVVDAIQLVGEMR